MSSTLSLLLQIGATDGATSTLDRVTKKLADMGKIGEESARHFENMSAALKSAGRAFAGAAYIADKMWNGTDAAGQMQAAMIEYENTVGRATDKTGDLAAKLRQAKDTAGALAESAGLSRGQGVALQTELARNGVAPGVIGGGAAYAAAALVKLGRGDAGAVSGKLATLGEQYGWKDGADFMRGADWINRAENIAKGSSEILAAIGQTAHAHGVGIENSAAMSAWAGAAGIDGGRVKMFMKGSAAPKGEQERAMLHLGLGRMRGDKFENLLMKNGKLKSFSEQSALIREKLGAIRNEGERTRLAEAIWGRGGMDVALRMATNSTRIDDVASDMQAMRPITDQVKRAAGGLTASAKALADSLTDLGAQVFEPLTEPLAALRGRIKAKVDGGTDYLKNYPTANKALAYGTGAAALGAAGYGAWKLIQAARSGGAGLRSLGGGPASAAAGIAQGKAVEAATGVTPVFITNWPAGGASGNSAASGLAEVAKAGKGAASNAATLATKLYAAAPAVVEFGAAMAPFAAMLYVKNWAEDTSNDQGRVETIKGWGQSLSNFLSIFGYDKEGEIEERRRKNREELGGEESAPVTQTINVHIDSEQVAQAVNKFNARQGSRH